jgi:hypothetical protein
MNRNNPFIRIQRAIKAASCPVLFILQGPSILAAIRPNERSGVSSEPEVAASVQSKPVAPSRPSGLAKAIDHAKHRFSSVAFAVRLTR